MLSLYFCFTYLGLDFSLVIYFSVISLFFTNAFLFSTINALLSVKYPPLYSVFFFVPSLPSYLLSSHFPTFWSYTTYLLIVSNTNDRNENEHFLPHYLASLLYIFLFHFTCHSWTFFLYLLLSTLSLSLRSLSGKSSSNKVNHRDTIRSDRSNSRRGHTFLHDMKRGGEKGKKWKVSSRGALQLITLLNADRTIRQFTPSGSQLRDIEMHVQTHAYV